jgi:glycosyltransferase involved in cell wall biosynthesis
MILRSVSIVVPAFNEALAIGKTLEEILEGVPPWLEEFELLVVDDGSRDGTGQAVREAAATDSRIRCLEHALNRGKGRALRTGSAAARCDWILFLDADQQVGMEELRQLGAGAGQAEAVVGYRVGRRSRWRRRLITALYRAVARVTLGIRVRDVGCPFKLFRRELIQSLALRSDGFFIDAEILHRLSAAGVHVQEVPVVWHPRRQGESTIRWRHLAQIGHELGAILIERATSRRVLGSGRARP